MNIKKMLLGAAISIGGGLVLGAATFAALPITLTAAALIGIGATGLCFISYTVRGTVEESYSQLEKAEEAAEITEILCSEFTDINEEKLSPCEQNKEEFNLKVLQATVNTIRKDVDNLITKFSDNQQYVDEALLNLKEGQKPGVQPKNDSGTQPKKEPELNPQSSVTQKKETPVELLVKQGTFSSSGQPTTASKEVDENSSGQTIRGARPRRIN